MIKSNLSLILMYLRQLKMRNMKNKQENSRTIHTHSMKVRWGSMEILRPHFFHDQAVESHSDESQKVQDEKTPGPQTPECDSGSFTILDIFSQLSDMLRVLHDCTFGAALVFL
ncbi:hypothetical protein ROHU_004330 [Labeo rohita]|uniref:Uncharacterized protein n=1 Tax=Labeo rohita TaxID=84645 RepID=A0A498NMP9_LABRO|nr:hypothetical protein ROHU_004330 [Labeo rohita]